ncbi:MAG TPA: ATP-binding protein [Pyrinomonadaceae bacterium]|jgi:chemotaxis protein histidine kinase CheA
MSVFSQKFLEESIDKLKLVQKSQAGEPDENWRREAFRTVHTVKGGAQAFGLDDAARLAGVIENLLSDSQNAALNLFPQSIESLIKLLERNETAASDILENLQNADQTSTRRDVLFSQIPSEVFGKFSAQERVAALNALRAGKNVFCAEAGFEVVNFADEYRKLRKIFSDKGDVLASLPSEKYKSAGKIGFRFFLASGESLEALRASAKDFAVEISSHDCRADDSKELFEMLARIAAYAETAAIKSGKRIGVTILSNNIKLSAERTAAFFEILLHLVRNAVDHAIAESGAVEIRFFEEPEGLYLAVADDGGGIDAAKVRARAAAKNLIAADEELSEQETLDLIFASELSTAARVTEISGRGVGLDAVKTAVEKMNGKISVKNRKANGAIFEIFVPRETE